MPEFLIKSLVCTALLYGVYRLSFKKERCSSAIRFYLLSILILSIAIPLLQIPVKFSLDTAFETLFSYIVVGAKNLLFVNLLEEVVVWGSPAGINWILWVERLYWIGVCVFSFRLLWFFVQIIRLHIQSRKHKLKNVNLYIHQQGYSPFSFLNNIYISKGDFKEASLRVVWKHELEHIRQLHTLESLCLEVLCCVFWFNPFVWVIRATLKKLHEYLVDESMMKQGIDMISYQRHLVNYAFGGEVFVQGNPFVKGSVKKRILMINRDRNESFYRWKFVFVLPVLFLLLCAFCFKPKEKILQEEEETTQYINAYKVERK